MEREEKSGAGQAVESTKRVRQVTCVAHTTVFIASPKGSRNGRRESTRARVACSGGGGGPRLHEARGQLPAASAPDLNLLLELLHRFCHQDACLHGPRPAVGLRLVWCTHKDRSNVSEQSGIGC